MGVDVQARLLTLAAVVFCAGISGARAQDRALQNIEADDAPAAAVVNIAVGDGWVADWALDDASGRIFASVATDEDPGNAKSAAGRVLEFDPVSGKVLREFPVGAKPRQILIKGGKLVVGVEAAVSLYVIDLKTNKVEGRVQLAGKGPYGMFCSKADNPWVYAISNTGDAWWDGEIFQVDVNTRKVRKQVRVQGWSQSHPVHVAMSPDGRYIVPDARGASSPSGADLMRVDEREMTFVNVRRFHDSFGHIVAAPNGRFWTLGGMLYPLDLKGKVRQFDGWTVAIHPKLDLVAAFGGNNMNEAGDKARRLTLQTLSTAAPLRQVLLDVSTADRSGERGGGARQRPRQPEQVWRDDPTLQFDAANDRLLVGYAQDAAVVDLKRMKVDAKPLLLLTLPDAVEAGTGKPLRIPITLSDPSLLGDTTFSLDEAPEGMRIEKREIVWTPGDSEVGRQTVVVKATRDGGATDSARVDVDVTRPSLDLGAPIAQLVTDPAGDRALAVLAVQPPAAQAQQGGFDENALGYDLVLLDLKAGRELARRRFREQLADVAIDAKAVYVAAQGVSRFNVLKPADLTDERRVFTDQPVNGFEIVPGAPAGSALAVGANDGIRIFDGKTLGPPIAGAMRWNSDHGRTSALTRPLSGGAVAFGPFALDPKTGQRKMLLTAAGLPLANPEANRFGPEAGLPTLWNRTVQGGQISGPSNTRIASLGHEGTTILLPQAPLAVTAVRKTEQQQGQQAVQSLRLDFRNLVDGGQLDPMVLLERPLDPNQQQRFRRQGPFGERAILLARGDRLLVAADGRMFTVTVPEDRVEKAQPPLHFAAELLPISAPVKDTLTLRPKAAGGQGKITYQLADEPEGVDIDPATGEVRVDTRAVWDKFRKSGNRPHPGLSGGDPLQQARATYKQLFGATTADYPIALNVRVAATDEENQRADLSAYVVLLAPAKEAEAAFAPSRPTTAPARPRPSVVVAPPGRDHDGTHDSGASGGADVRGLERKIDNLTNLVLELNRRVQELEAKQGKASATRRAE